LCDCGTSERTIGCGGALANFSTIYTNPCIARRVHTHPVSIELLALYFGRIVIDCTRNRRMHGRTRPVVRRSSTPPLAAFWTSSCFACRSIYLCIHVHTPTRIHIHVSDAKGTHNSEGCTKRTTDLRTFVLSSVFIIMCIDFCVC